MSVLHRSSLLFRRLPVRQLTTALPTVDLRSDTVTKPSRDMLEYALTVEIGDDVYGEDPTVLELQEYMANLCDKEAALYVPTGTMANLVAILAHCHGRASEIIVGQQSHICLWEGGNVSEIGSIFCRQVEEDPRNAQFDLQTIRDNTRKDIDDHWPDTKLLCLENTHNMLGGIALSPDYITEIGTLCREELDMAVHMDGARLMNALVSQNRDCASVLASVDSVSICFSKALGAPLGSVLVGSTEAVRLAKRARKRLGGGMRQAGVVAAMGLYAMKHNVQRLVDDHRRAQRLATELSQNGFQVMHGGKLDTNICYFQLPHDTTLSVLDFCERLQLDYGIQIGGGYSSGGQLIRAVTHYHITDEDIDRTIEAMVELLKC